MLLFLVVMTVSITQRPADLQMAAMGVMRLRQLAEMGAAVAALPQIKPSNPLLRRSVSALAYFEVILGTEEFRLNLNSTLTEEHLPVFERLFRSWRMWPTDAKGVVATLIGRRDADDLKRRPYSVEKFNCDNLCFSDLPFNRKFISKLHSPAMACEPSPEAIGS